MNNWIIPSNSSKFDLAKFLSKYNNEVDWKQSANFEVGDVVYIYCTKPEMRIRYKMNVIATDIPSSKTKIDKKFWSDEAELKKGMEYNRYFRMELVSETNSDLLTMDELHRQGVKGYFYGPRTIDRELSMYIDKAFNK
ncbi:MAG: hypothetical protein KBT45_09025 [Bacteroidales bacterium]|nr:hypothetical protein [Candidatus Colimorpha pelethequi]